MFRNVLLILTSLWLITAFTACGKTGKLYLPDDKPAENQQTR